MSMEIMSMHISYDKTGWVLTFTPLPDGKSLTSRLVWPKASVLIRSHAEPRRAWK